MTRTTLRILPVSVVLCLAIAPAFAGGPRARAAFIVDEWFVSTHVHDSSSGGDDSSGFWTVQNPFHDSHSASVGDSSSTASYDFAWADWFGAFLIETTQAAEGVPSSVLFSSSSGFIWITPAEDLSLSIDSAFSYDLGADPMLASLSVSVFATDPFTSLFHQEVDADSFFDPPVGTLSVEGDIILPAGRTWAMSYDMELITWGDTVGHFATGSGFVDFQITPEPSTLGLLVLGALGLLKRSRSRHG